MRITITIEDKEESELDDDEVQATISVSTVFDPPIHDDSKHTGASEMWLRVMRALKSDA